MQLLPSIPASVKKGEGERNSFKLGYYSFLVMKY